MATTPQMLQAINGMQANVQGQLPVIPNNGNPGGAYNMASADPTNEFPSPQVNPLAWMDPSPYMTNIQQILEQQAKKLADPSMGAMKFNTIVKDGQFNIQPLTDNSMQMDSSLPMLPTQNPYSVTDPNSGLPVMPAQYTPGR